ncbi:MlaD family protein [Pontiella agarivorans]|uniref:MlaD family protein n=1 Tax=Pontiella agarivorans TaxID=3038953 RepID=A0ABU5MTF5_9BACT|nr:MlaD family protein [Pontiella agarivorans]MDZ8117499.1 MlaD family protein [Pontiella agarivorans]
MRTKPHYFAIGIFVIVAVLLGLAGLVLLSSDALQAPDRFIETYVDESVQGIDVGTPFKLRGVKVGSVSRVSLVSSVYETGKMYVLIRIALDKRHMDLEDTEFEKELERQIRNGLRLHIVPQGITGLSFVEADLFPERLRPPLEIDWEPEVLYVPSIPSTLSVLSRSLERFAEQLNTLNLDVIGSDIEEITGNLNETIVHVQELMANAAEASEDVAENIRTASHDLPEITANLKHTTDQLEMMVNSSDQDIDQVLQNLRYITDDARELIRMLKRYPGMLLSEPPEQKMSR